MSQRAQIGGARNGGGGQGNGSARRHGASKGASSQVHIRAIARDRWNRTFGGNAYLEPGAANRLTMSLRSPSLQDIDFALERLAQVSSIDPDLLRLSDYPGLLDALLHIIKSYIDSRSAKPAHAATTGSDLRTATSILLNQWATETTQSTPKSRAYEAALILRNIAPERANPKQLAASKRLRPLIVSVLEQALNDDSGDLAELQIYMIEVLEVIAESTALRLTPRASAATANPAKKLKSSAADSPASARLFPLLARLTRSPDRAIIIAAFRCLTACCLNDESRPVVSFVNADLALPKATQHPLETAIELLALRDVELVTAAMYFIYQQTLVPANAVAFASRPDLGHIVVLVLRMLRYGTQQQSTTHLLPQQGTMAAECHERVRQRWKRQVHPTVTGPRPTFEQICSLAEPLRAREWMRSAFEHAEDAEVTQVELWTTYRHRFEQLYAAGQTGPLLPAADLIKMTSEVFEGAKPMVVEKPERKFIIRHMRRRDPLDKRSVFVCRWSGCSAPLGPGSPDELFQHICQAHLTPGSDRCCWVSCEHKATRTDSNAKVEEMKLHVSSHMPVYHPPPEYGNPPKALSDYFDDPETPMTVDDCVRLGVGAGGDVEGLPFVAALVLRNLARTARNAVASSGGTGEESTGDDQQQQSKPTAISIESLTANETSILVLLERAAEGDKAEEHDDAEKALEGLDKVIYARAKHSMSALQSFEEEMVQMAFSDASLGKLIGDILSLIS
ncbi:hypothetical protein ACM66B_002841 [Microbotryomycetes sp. NB124-2]